MAEESPPSLAIATIRPCSCGAKAKYQCPRCNAPYCSLPCYQTHGVQCTELFARAQVEEAMRTGQLGGTSPDKRRITELLQREYSARQGSDGNDPAAFPPTSDGDGDGDGDAPSDVAAGDALPLG